MDTKTFVFSFETLNIATRIRQKLMHWSFVTTVRGDSRGNEREICFI